MKSFKCFTKGASMKPVRFAIVIALLAAGMGAAVAHANLNSSNHSNDEALIRRIDALWSFSCAAFDHSASILRISASSLE